MRILALLLLLASAVGCVGTRWEQVHPGKELDIWAHADGIDDEYDFRAIGYIYGDPTIVGESSERGYSCLYRRTDYKSWDCLTLWLTTDGGYEVLHLVFNEPERIQRSTIAVYRTGKFRKLPLCYAKDLDLIKQECVSVSRPYTTRDSDHSDKALFAVGMSQINSNDPDEGIALLTRLIKDFPESEYLIQARLELARVFFSLAKKARKDRSLLLERAKLELSSLRVSQLSEAQKRQHKALVKMSLEISTEISENSSVDRLLYLGEFYQRKAHWSPNASRRYLEEVMEKYGDHPRAGEAQALLDKLPKATKAK